jgi:adenylate kinase
LFENARFEWFVVFCFVFRRAHLLTEMKRKPNVLVTGTPGTGKSATVEGALEQASNMRGLNVGAEVRRLGFHDGEEDGALLIDEDRLLDHLEELLGGEGGFLVEHHGCELFPERWFDAVVVLQTDNTLLWDRLLARGYLPEKIAENVECEIMQVKKHVLLFLFFSSFASVGCCRGSALFVCASCCALLAE